MKVLVVGTGAREHAIVHALVQDPGVESVTAAPGNPGIAEIATCADLPGAVTDGAAVADLAERLAVDLVVIGPEAPLVAGVADVLRERGIAVFGPSARAARLEGSKAFAKEVMAAAGVPTAQARTCATEAEVAEALDAFGAPYVVKDDGLAAGKGSSSPRTVTPPWRTRASAWPRTRVGSSSRTSSTARRRRCSASATAGRSCRWPWRRTSSASATETPVRTPVAWGPTRR